MLDKCNFKKQHNISYRLMDSGNNFKIINYVFGIDNDKNLTQIANENINNLNILNCSVFYKKDLSQV